MRRQDHGRDDYHDYFNNLADQYLVWPTITLGVHIYTWILSMIYGIYMDSDGTKGGALENGNILCYLTGQATQGIKLTCFVRIHVVKICAGISIDQDMFEATGVSA